MTSGWPDSEGKMADGGCLVGSGDGWVWEGKMADWWEGEVAG